MIRRVLPKKTSFDNLTQDDINLMMSHINSYNRKKLNNQSAHQLFSFINGGDILDKLGIKSIPANEINLTPLLLKKLRNVAPFGRNTEPNEGWNLILQKKEIKFDFRLT